MSQLTNLPLICPRCNKSMSRAGESLTCPSGHEIHTASSYYEFAESHSQPHVRLFDGPWGSLYDWGIKKRRFGPLLNWAWQGSSAQQLRRMHQRMDEGIASREEMVVVDVPVGGGPALANANRLLGGLYIGVDLSSHQLRRAARSRRRAGIGDRALLIRANALALPLADHSVDTLMTFNGLHLIPDRPAAMAEFHRVLKPGGRLIGSTLVEDPRRVSRMTRPWFFCARLKPVPTAEEIEVAGRGAGFVAWEQTLDGPLLLLSAKRG